VEDASIERSDDVEPTLSRVGPMNTTTRPSGRRILAVGVTAALTLAACTGSDSSIDDETITTRAERDDVVTSDSAAPPETAVVEPTTTPPTTAPPTTAPPTTAAPTTTTTEAPGDDLAAFCTAAEEFFLPGRALDFGDINDPAVVRVVFRILDDTSGPAADLAPATELGDAVIEAKRLLDIALPGLEAADFDVNNGDAIPNNEVVGQALIDYGGLLGEIQGLLESECGSDLGALDARAIALSEQIAAGEIEAPESSSDAPPSSGEFVDIQNDDGSISVTVPAEWSDVDGADEDLLRQITAAPDAAVFTDSFTEEGMFIITAEASGLDDWVAVYESTIDRAGDGSSPGAVCTVADEFDYDDGVYTGTEAVLDCGSTETETRIIGGRDADGELFFIVGIVHPIGRVDIRDAIAQSFLL